MIFNLKRRVIVSFLLSITGMSLGFKKIGLSLGDDGGGDIEIMVVVKRW